QPIKPDNRQLLLTFSVDAVGLQSAPVDKQLSKEKASVLAHAELDKYLVPIVQRSLFTPGNDSAPRFSRRGTEETILVNESKKFKLSAFDDQGIASYEIVKHDLPEGEATIDWDPQGNVTIMSKKLGTYTLEVRATDKGLPAKTSEIAKFSIRIGEPAPVRKPEPEAPKFDFAKTAFFIASV
ncbi:MAG: cadherin repeat domain-containing protein, partial [Planctomycetaceae bacterium]|nr:cadherin repeat domain-containing protein [Planctomycetaceae bacterium]